MSWDELQALLVGVVSTRLVMYWFGYRKEPKLEYGWECPEGQCDYAIESSDAMFTLRVADQHAKQHE